MLTEVIAKRTELLKIPLTVELTCFISQAIHSAFILYIGYRLIQFLPTIKVKQTQTFKRDVYKRQGAYVIGSRAAQKCMVRALLEPIAKLREYEANGQGFQRLALLLSLIHISIVIDWGYNFRIVGYLHCQ